MQIGDPARRIARPSFGDKRASVDARRTIAFDCRPAPSRTSLTATIIRSPADRESIGRAVRGRREVLKLASSDPTGEDW
jgi:hypothetical protein